MADKLIIFDTPLRDGEQSPGASMTKDEKLRIARQLERLKVDVIEAGFAASSNGDFEAVHAIATAEPLAPSRHRADLPSAFDAILARALAKDPSQRWTSARDLADALRGLSEGAGATSNSSTDSTVARARSRSASVSPSTRVKVPHDCSPASTSATWAGSSGVSIR